MKNKQNEMVRKMVRELTKNEIMPYDREMDKTGEFPWHIIEKLRKHGIFGVTDDPEYGGAGLDEYAEAIMTEELAYGSSSVAFTINAHFLGKHLFVKHGSQELKDKYLRDIVTGDKLCCFGLTEPAAGSDAAGMETTAVLDGDEWVLNGQKTWITNFSVSGLYFVTAKTDPSKGTRGISMFIVERDNPGLRLGHEEDKMGVRGSNTGEFYLEDCRIPKGNLVGELNRGFVYSMETLDIGRTLIGSMAIGIIRRSIDESVKYANERIAFGRSIGKFQAISFKIADMEISLAAAEALAEQVAQKRIDGKPFTVEAAQLKAFASEAAMRAADSAIQIHGGNGYSREFPPERLLRDAKILEIAEGTTEILKMIIGNTSLNKKR